MKYELTVAGAVLELAQNLDLDRSVVFPGAGMVLASSILRSSKNAYELLVILKTRGVRRTFASMKDAVHILQGYYDRFGRLDI